MEWFKIVLIVLYVIGALSNIALIGEERKPITKGTAALSVLLNGFLIWGVINWL